MFFSKKQDEKQKELKLISTRPCVCGAESLRYVGGLPGYQCTKCGLLYMRNCLEPIGKYIEVEGE